MERYFTHYWKNSMWRKAQRELNGQSLDLTSGNQFTKRGVCVGDTVYVVTILKGQMYVCGRMVVEQISDPEEAMEYFVCGVEDLWDYPDVAREHLISDDCTDMRFNLSVPGRIAKKLKFKGTVERLTFKAPNVLDPQTLRGVRELEPESAMLLDSLLDK